MCDLLEMPDVDTTHGSRAGLDWAYDTMRAGHFQIFHIQNGHVAIVSSNGSSQTTMWPPTVQVTQCSEKAKPCAYQTS